MGFVLLAALAQAAPADPPQERVDEAIRKGVAWLRTVPLPAEGKAGRDAEIVLLAIIHGGATETDPRAQEILKHLLESELDQTYNVSLQAMCLEELDRAKYQMRIYQCAQFLVDNMHENGRWSYGSPSPFVKQIPSPAPGSTPSKSSVRSFEPASGGKPAVKRKLPVRKMVPGAAGGGDNSNSQYAALGLRACHDAGIVIPRDLLEKARKSWLDTQHEAGTGKAVATGAAVPRGWCYSKGGEQADKCALGGEPYPSMTAGAVSALVIYDGLLGVDAKKDRAVRDGMAWLASHWSVTENAPTPETGGPQKDTRTWLSYYLYALERAGMLCEAAKIGDHDWYREGATFLLEKQRPDGSWRLLSNDTSPPCDTAFAILFLKRATRPMVASTDRFNPRK